MFNKIGLSRELFSIALVTGLLVLPVTALPQESFDHGSLRGEFVLSLDGTFVSAPPPFTGTVLPFKASQIARLAFDGTGLAWGEATLTFHHPDVPFGVVSRLALNGTYNVAPSGRTVISLDEFPLDINGEPGPARSSSTVLECYVVRRMLQLSCVLHTLVSYQQGPQPRNLPVTMSGPMQRQF